jgi:L-ascorbate metabolism protein UlaG (beta-lactamase superfamily)
MITPRIGDAYTRRPMQIDFIRSATFILHYAGTTLLIDPMFNPAGAVDPIPNTANQRRNPTVDLPFDDATLQRQIATLDGALVTHLHNDHWDARATELLPKTLPILCQPEDESRLRERGFSTVTPITQLIEWRGITFTRTPALHGTGEIGARMAPVSGFVLRHPDEGTLYIASDTIWCDEVAVVLDRERPDVTIVNTGGARFLVGDPIIMTAEDVVALCEAAPETRVVATHLEALNHCATTRADLKAALTTAGFAERVLIPDDGEQLDLTARN